MAVGDGSGAIYVMGGQSEFVGYKDVFRYDTATHALSTLPVTLDAARVGGGAAWAGGSIYILGGDRKDTTGGACLSSILRVDPANATASVVAPFPKRFIGGAASDGRYVYYFGGNGCSFGRYLDEILRFDTLTLTTETLTARLPSPRGGVAAFWSPISQTFYLFGGVGAVGGAYFDEVLEFDPAAGTVEVLAARLPRGTTAPAVAAVDGGAYVMGGYDNGPANAIYRFDVATETLSVVPFTLPDGFRYGASAAGVGSRAFAFGGGFAHGGYRPTARIDVVGEDVSGDVDVAVSGGYRHTNLSWASTGHGHDFDAARIYLSNGRTHTLVASVDSDGTGSYAHADLPDATQMCYRVALLRAGVEVGWSRVTCDVTYGPPSAPENVRATSRDPHPLSVNVTWTKALWAGHSELSIQRYHVYRVVEDALDFERIGTTTDVWFNDMGCPINKSCLYGVRAENEYFEGGMGYAMAEGTTFLPGAAVEDGSVAIWNDADFDQRRDTGEEFP